MTTFETAAGKVRHTDPLLQITKILLYALMVLAGFIAVVMAIAVPGIWFIPNTVMIDEAKLTPDMYGAISVILGMIAAGAVLAVLFLRQIIAIIDSVKLGSPFVPQNATRLRIAAWLLLAIEVLSYSAESIGAWIERVAPTAKADIGIEFSMSWLITALLLFILARVFDQGTRLAEDVEGTV